MMEILNEIEKLMEIVIEILNIVEVILIGYCEHCMTLVFICTIAR